MCQQNINFFVLAKSLHDIIMIWYIIVWPIMIQFPDASMCLLFGFNELYKMLYMGGMAMLVVFGIVSLNNDIVVKQVDYSS